MKKGIFLALVSAVFIVGCSGERFQFVNKDILYKGIELYKKGRYDDAKKLIKEAIYKGKDLTTKELMEARYYLANAYYKNRNYIDAIVEFEEFLALFPTSPYVPEVLYKLADSYLKVSPDPDKDLTYPRKALDRAIELAIKYPNSPYAEKARKIIEKVKKMEVAHYSNIARLYEKLGKYYGAARYYKFLLKEYSDFLDQNKFKYKLAENLLRLKDQYRSEIRDLNKEQEKIRKKIAKTNNYEEKRVLRNRLKLHEEHKKLLLTRIKEGKEEAKKILEELRKIPQYKNLAEDLLREVK